MKIYNKNNKKKYFKQKWKIKVCYRKKKKKKEQYWQKRMRRRKKKRINLLIKYKKINEKNKRMNNKKL